jgi:hypothetical protein
MRMRIETARLSAAPPARHIAGRLHLPRIAGPRVEQTPAGPCDEDVCEEPRQHLSAGGFEKASEREHVGRPPPALTRRRKGRGGARVRVHAAALGDFSALVGKSAVESAMPREEASARIGGCRLWGL